MVALVFLAHGHLPAGHQQQLAPRPAAEGLTKVQVDVGDLEAKDHRRVEAIARHDTAAEALTEAQVDVGAVDAIGNRRVVASA